MKSTIWTIHTINSNDLLTGRTVGVYDSFEVAREVVMYNKGGFQEEYYTHLVMENFEFGTYPKTIETRWFQWESSGKDSSGLTVGKWIPCEKPNWVGNVTGFAIG